MKGRIVTLIKKEFQQILRDKKMRMMILVAPVLQIVLLGYAANMDVTSVPLGVYDLDHGVRSRELVDRFLNSGYFVLAARADSFEDLDGFFMDGKTEVNLVIPDGFSRDIDAGRGAALQLTADGAVSNSATIALSYATGIVSRYANAGSVAGFAAATAPEIRAWYNPELRTRLFMVPGVLALLLMMFTLIFTSLSVVKEKELGTIEQLIVTPLKSTELIIGKLAPFVIVSLVMSVLVILAATFVFRIYPRGSVLLLLALCLVFALSTLGLGLFVSTIAANQQQAMFFSIFFFMFPMTILSGFVFPVENMPAWIQPITYVLPLRYFFVIVRGIYLKGDGVRELWPQALALLAIGATVITVSMLRFKKRLD
ncbi:MAG: ABC transporter permease [Spirochaetae bacterium HGW-Spirochaetae-3]|jgi:ABC-2 type transport system permease protein|nr:MAG: ABC transporter permease [Spirochaetae bacterium HGW-Spirochaetae-3]